MKTYLLISFLVFQSFQIYGQKIKTWSSPAFQNVPAFNSFYVLIINQSEIPDTLVQNWVANRLRSYFDQVDTIFTYRPDSSNYFKNNHWVAPIEKMKSDAVLTLKIQQTTPLSKKKLKKWKKKDYLPAVHNFNKNSFWGYLSNEGRHYFGNQQTETYSAIELNIYKKSSLELVWSAVTTPFEYQSQKNQIQNTIYNLIRKSAHDHVINDEQQ